MYFTSATFWVKKRQRAVLMGNIWGCWLEMHSEIIRPQHNIGLEHCCPFLQYHVHHKHNSTNIRNITTRTIFFQTSFLTLQMTSLVSPSTTSDTAFCPLSLTPCHIISHTGLLWPHHNQEHPSHPNLHSSPKPSFAFSSFSPLSGQNCIQCLLRQLSPTRLRTCCHLKLSRRNNLRKDGHAASRLFHSQERKKVLMLPLFLLPLTPHIAHTSRLNVWFSTHRTSPLPWASLQVSTAEWNCCW